MRRTTVTIALGLSGGCPATNAGGDGATTTSAATATSTADAGATANTADETTGVNAFDCNDPFAAVTGLFADHCAGGDCHDADAPAASLALVGDWPAEVVGQTSNLCGERLLVAPGDPGASELWVKVAGEPDCGVNMPLGAAMLSPAEVDCIAVWIDGAVSECEMCGTGACVDVASDATNCGGCGVACPTGVACQAGACACPAGADVCADACVDTTASGQHCGACDQPCERGLFCLASACVSDCGALAECGGGCVDTTTNAQHCGGCDAPCPGGAACEGGSCACGDPVSWAQDVEPLLAANCTSMGCHGFPIPKEDLDLRLGAGYDHLVDVTAMQCNGRRLVAPGDPDNSYLVDKLLGVDLCFGTQMPKDPPPMDPADIEMISRWICQGAPNN